MTSYPNLSVILSFQSQKNGMVYLQLVSFLYRALHPVILIVLFFQLLFQHHSLLLILVYIFLLLTHQKSSIVFWNPCCLIKKSIINRLFYLNICNLRVMDISTGLKALLKPLPAEMCYFLPLTVKELNK